MPLAYKLMVDKNFANVFRSSKQCCVELEIEEDAEPISEKQVLNLIDAFDTREFVLLFRSLKDNTTFFYWKIRGTKGVMFLECTALEENLRNFLKNFLISSIKKGFDGKWMYFSLHFLTIRHY